MGDNAEDPAPQRTLLSTRREYLECLERLLVLVRRELRIFDPDLSELGLETPAKIATLRQFLQSSRTHRIYIAVHDTEFVATRCPRLLGLLGSFPRELIIQQTQGEALKAQDCFVLADDSHLVRRSVAAQSRGVSILNDPRDCRSILDRFGEIWESSVPSVSPSASGL